MQTGLASKGLQRRIWISTGSATLKDRQVADLDVTDRVFFGPRILLCGADAPWGGRRHACFGQISKGASSVSGTDRAL